MIRVLILRFSSIGDIVLTTPVIRALKLQIPNIEIHYATKRQFSAALNNNPYIDHLHLLDQDNGTLVQSLKNYHFDYIIDLHHNLRTWSIGLQLKGKRFTFRKLNFLKWLLVHFKINFLPKIHVVERYFEAVSSLNVVYDQQGLDFFTSTEDQVEVKKNLGDISPGYIALAVGAQHFTKQIPTPKIIRLIADNPHQKFILLGGKNDANKAFAIEQASPTNVVNAVNKLSLGASAVVIKNSSLLIAPDSGLMHIAAALQKKTILVWGNTIPDFGMGSFDNKAGVINLEVDQLACRPCSKLGHNTCPKKHFNCMNLQEINLSKFD